MTEIVAANVAGKPSRPPAAAEGDGVLASVMDVLSEGVLVLDEQGTILRANAAYTAMVGKRADEIVGLSFVDSTPEDIKARALAQFAELQTTAQVVETEWPFLGPDGKSGSLLCRARAVATPEGRRVIVCLRDVTELRRLEARDRIVGKVLESAPVILWSLDKEGNYLTWEGRGVEALGTKPGQLVGQNCLEQWKGTEAYPNLLKAMAGEEFSTTLTIPGPRTYDVWYLPVKDALGSPNGMVGLGWDVTRLRSVEAELREKVDLIERQRTSLHLLQRVVDSAPFIIASIDVAGTFTDSQGKGLEALGLKAGDVVGQNAFEVYNNPEIAEALTKALSGEEVRMVAAPAPDVFFESWYVPMLDARSNEVVGATLLALDVTERMRAENELRDKLELIERQSATIRALATPIIKVWDEVLCLPVIGTVDSARTAEMMDALLQSIVREQARFAVVDLTGVEVVDTSTADHVIQLFKAANVLGVEGILCGIRPAVAQTVVALGVDLTSVRTMRTLQDALRYCIRARNAMLEKAASRRGRPGAGAAKAAKAKT